jgi:DNA-binding MarR family transcriptional regulator
MHLSDRGVLAAGAALPLSRRAEVLDVSVSSATGIVTRMEERRLVERIHDREDRRIVMVRLTAEGQRTADSVESAERDRLATILGDLDPGELACVLDAARLFSEAVRRHAAARDVPARDTPARRSAVTGPV